MPTYYVDGANGDDLWTGIYSTPQNGDGPWATVEKAIKNGALVAGDVVWVRRNQTYVEPMIWASSSGQPDSLIELKGDDGSVPAWTGDANVKPCIDFNDAVAQVFWSGRVWWLLKSFEVKNSGSTMCAIQVLGGGIVFLEDLVLHDNLNGGILCDNSVVFGKNIDIDDDAHRATQNIRGYMRLENVTADGGVEGFVNAGGELDLVDSTAGEVSQNTQADIFVSQQATRVRCRNVKLFSTGASEGLVQFGTTAQRSSVVMEDFGQVKGAHKAFYFQGTVEKDTVVTRVGGASSSAKMLPNANTNEGWPLRLNEDDLKRALQVWCPAEETTITVYIRATEAWVGYPTADELYIQAEYWDGVTAQRAKSTKSTQVLSDGSTWVAFSTTFTPATAGFVYVEVSLGKYESAKGIHVDVKPVVT